MILITSGAYLGSEFTSMLGRLPPSFLPVGNRRLYELQIADLATLGEDIFLSLPRDFEVPEEDARRLTALGITVVPVPPDVSLGASVVYALNTMEYRAGPVRILHGDTLCGRLEGYGLDLLLSGETVEYYSWAEYHRDGTRLRLSEALPSGACPRHVLCGYFAIADGAALIRHLCQEDFNFIAGLDSYGAEHPLTVEHCESWLDFGHVQTYFRSKAIHTTERAFNSLTVTPKWLEKTSTDRRKIEAEAAWFEALPRPIKAYAPHYLGRVETSDDRAAYSLEYLYLNTLSEIAVFGQLPVYSWLHIFRQCLGFVREASMLTVEAANANTPPTPARDYATKTADRLERFAADTSFDLSAETEINGRKLPPLSIIAEDVAAHISDAEAAHLGVLHGDLCFSNIFHDFRSAQIRVVDPRGQRFDGTPTIWGDTRYDCAKLMQCAWGRYDFLVAGYCRFARQGDARFTLSFPHQGTAWDDLGRELSAIMFADGRLNEVEIKAMVIQLFLSMLPLHYDRPDRQLAFVANALRLFAELEDAA